MIRAKHSSLSNHENDAVCDVSGSASDDDFDGRLGLLNDFKFRRCGQYLSSSNAGGRTDVEHLEKFLSEIIKSMPVLGTGLQFVECVVVLTT